MVVNYREGDLFAVPLTEAGYGVGLVARAQPAHGGVLFGYFFGPKRANVPALDELEAIAPTDAVLIRRFGHLEIRQGRWPVIGNQEEWDRTQWAMPTFIRRPSLGSAMLVTYADDDPSRMISSVKANDNDLEEKVPEGLLGAALVVSLLTKQLEGSE
jgi:hypothetical protein